MDILDRSISTYLLGVCNEMLIAVYIWSLFRFHLRLTSYINSKTVASIVKEQLYKKAICYLLLIQLSRRAIVKKAVNDAIRAIMIYQYVIDHGR